MRPVLQVGDHAPDFDLASTEDVILMLRDEVPRTPVLLYFFSGIESDRTRADLVALKDAGGALAKVGVKVLGISAAPLDGLKALQRELGLGFPLLRDDRNLSAAYGVEARAESSDPAEGAATDAAIMVLVARDQKVTWIANPAPPASEAVQTALAALPRASSSVNYPRKVINRLVDRWVN